MTKGTYTISGLYLCLLGTFFESESKLEFTTSDDWKTLIAIIEDEMTGELIRQ